MKRAHVILNGSAGAGHDDATAHALREQFRQAGVEAQVVLAANGGEMTAAARKALAAASDVVVAAGGDGTINAVASVLAGSGVPFGVLPLGTLNHFAKDIGMPLELEEAVRTIGAGRTRRVDVGQVNDRIFLNNSSLGLYPDIVHDRDTSAAASGAASGRPRCGHRWPHWRAFPSCPCGCRWMANGWRGARRSSSSATTNTR